MLITSCSPVACLILGNPCKKVKFLDESGSPIKSASAGGDPMSPANMNSSNEFGYLILSKHWANRETELVTIFAPGFQDYTIKFSEIPKIVVMKKK